jgi:murein DD-endopeptidase MepM/ murein hydrolase activator NlpD
VRNRPYIPKNYKHLPRTSGRKAKTRRALALRWHFSAPPMPDLTAAFRRYPKPLAAFAIALIILAAGSGMTGIQEPPVQATESHSLALPEPGVAETEPEQASKIPEKPKEQWTRVTVKPGQTLAQLFEKQGLGARVVHNVVHVDKNTARLARIFPGDELAFRFNANKEFAALEYQLDEATKLQVTYVDGSYASTLIADEMINQPHTASGVIEDSLFLAGRRAKLTDALIMEMAGLFGWDIDFVLDIRAGDAFHLVYERVYRNGEFLRTGDILAATFVNQGKAYQAIRFETENGYEYFAPDGRNMKKAFLRAPLNFSYISSSFNPKRFHPILKRVKAHNGIDYRAPSGTPVFAAGNGKVLKAAYSKYNGNHVFIQHGNNIVTKYLHFTKRNVKTNQRVQQGQVIGYVGATGLAEAPHLHYEFLVNGVHRNPRTVQLPKADPLPKQQLASFQKTAEPMLSQLDRLQQQASLLAMGE